MDSEYSPKVLIVDDNENSLLTLKKALGKLNAEIITAGNGEEAVIHTKQRDFALIILDVQMPGMDGFETAEMIRQGVRNQFTPIIFLTAVFVNENNILKGYHSGAVDYITKPFNSEILLGKVQTFLELDKAKSELIRIKTNYENVVQDQTDFICRTDKNFQLTFANRAFLLAFSIIAEQLHSLSIMDFIPENDREKIKRTLLLLAPNNPIIKLSHKLIVSGQHQFSVSTVFRALYDEHFTHTGYQLVIRDVSREMKTRDELLVAKKRSETSSYLKALLLSNLAHDLKSPMNALLGMSELLAGSKLDEEQQEDLQVIRNSAIELLSVINVLNEFSALDAGKTEFYNVWFELPEKLQAAENELESTVLKHDNKVSMLTEGELPSKIKSDPKKITGVLDHIVLCFNALVRNNLIRISVKSEYKDPGHVYLSFSVSVSASGIPERIAEQILNFLQKDDPALSEHNGETALRLFVAKMLIGLMGGKLDFSFREETGNATFLFRINVETEPQNPTAKKHIAILVVEDNILNQQVIASMLKKRGFVYDLAENGHTAIEKFKENRFDFILMDIQMPGMDGYETTKQMRDIEKKKPELKRIKIYALTANATSDDYKLGVEAGMDGFFNKPLNIDELERIIRKTIEGE
jgi:PAS domain S-box-containing protein